MTIRALVEPPEPESTTLHAVTFTNTDAGSGVVVVRLVPEALIPAEEATLQVLGLVPTRSREVGHTTTRSVGFPAWVISTHPPRAPPPAPARGRAGVAVGRPAEGGED